MSVTRGETKLSVTQDDFKQLQKKVDQLVIAKSMESECPPSPPAPPPPRDASRSNSTLKDNSPSAADPPGRARRPALPPTPADPNRAYDKVILPSEIEIPEHQYEPLQFEKGAEGNDIPSRLCRVEAQQARILKTQENIMKEMKSVKELVEKLQQTVDKVQRQFLENSDTLGQQLLQVRRDIQAASTKDPSYFR